MTAINVLITETSACIVTDTRARSATMHSFDVPKVMPIPHRRMAVATRGPMDALGRVVAAICASSFDYGSARAYLADHYKDLGLDGVEVIVAGWGESGPAAFIISSVNTGGKVQDIGYVLATPTVSPEHFEAFAEDPLKGMPALLQEQAMGHGAVGGFMNVYQIDQATIGCYTADVLYSPEIRAPEAARSNG